MSTFDYLIYDKYSDFQSQPNQKKKKRQIPWRIYINQISIHVLFIVHYGHPSYIIHLIGVYADKLSLNKEAVSSSFFCSFSENHLSKYWYYPRKRGIDKM